MYRDRYLTTQFNDYALPDYPGRQENKSRTGILGKRITFSIICHLIKFKINPKFVLASLS
jgi:hypothetical protein